MRKLAGTPWRPACLNIHADASAGHYSRRPRDIVADAMATEAARVLAPTSVTLCRLTTGDSVDATKRSLPSTRQCHHDAAEKPRSTTNGAGYRRRRSGTTSPYHETVVRTIPTIAICYLLIEALPASRRSPSPAVRSRGRDPTVHGTNTGGTDNAGHSPMTGGRYWALDFDAPGKKSPVGWWLEISAVSRDPRHSPGECRLGAKARLRAHRRLISQPRVSLLWRDASPRPFALFAGTLSPHPGIRIEGFIAP